MHIISAKPGWNKKMEFALGLWSGLGNSLKSFKAGIIIHAGIERQELGK